MSDFLVELGKNPQARRIVKALGLPIPLPPSLRRDRDPWTARPLADRKVVVGASDGAGLVAALAETLAAAGADTFLSMPAPLAAFFREPGESFGRPAQELGALPEKTPADALVLDASGVATAADLRALYDFFHPLVGKLARSGRALLLGRPLEGLEPEAAAAQAALEGFVRSLAKEIGRSGATANLVRVAVGAESRLGPVLRFLLSAKSAFVTAQPLVVTAEARAFAEPPVVRPLEKKIALVTGAARGIGEATARLFAQEGAHVICLDRPADDGPTSQLARAIGGTALLVDLGDPSAPALVAEAVAKLGGVDVVVHNAGITRDKTLARMDESQWDSVLAVNLAAVARVHAALVPHLHDHGRVVCLSSIAGLAGNVGQTAYATSKAGIVGFVRAAAAGLGERGITVNAVAPGFIETRLTAAIPMAIREVARRLAALSQGGLPEDVGQALLFLASPGAHGITGRTLRVCGGAFVGA